MAFRGNLLVSLLLFAAAATASGKSARLDLFPAAPGASIAKRARDDRRRLAHISARLPSRQGGSRRVAAGVAASSSSAVSLPMSSGAYSGTGQYFVKLLVGTPAQEFTLVADTGSDLTWVKCAGSSPPGRVFRPEVSKSWAPVPCSSDTCKLDVPFSLANCSSSASPCSYDYRYKEGSAGALGIVGTESATIALPGGKVAQLKDVVLGCSSSHDGQSFRSADGVLSLGNAKISFATRAAARFGGCFSYCLVDHLAPRNATGYLAFGPGQVPRTPSETQTMLFLDPQMPFYGVKVDAIYVAGKALDIPAEVWDAKSGGVILDSGNTLTVLAAPAYKAVVAALSKHLAGVPKVSFPPFEHCYDWTARRPGAPEIIPKLTVQFAGSARLEPPAKSYVIDVKPGVKCIGVQEGEWPGVSVIGNIMQQEHLWKFDLKNMQVRFKKSDCSR